MPIPPFEADGLLPPGVHEASLAEVEAALGFSDRRQRQLVGLKSALDDLASAGCRAVILDGSFVTSKPDPGDFDMAWEPEGVDVDRLNPVLTLLQPPRTAQKIKYGGDILPDANGAFTEFFQGTRDGDRKGVIRVDLRTGR